MTLRILYAIPGYGERHMGGLVHREMAQEIRSRGHDYRIVVPVATPAEAARRDPFDEGLAVHRVAVEERASDRLLNRAGRPLLRYHWLFGVVRRLSALLRSQGPFDVLIAEGAYPMGAAAWLATRALRVPYLVSVIGGDFLANAEARYGYARYAGPRLLMGRALGGAAVVRAISPLAGERARRLGCPPSRLALVPRNVAASAFAPADVDPAAFRREARARLERRPGLGEGRLIVGVGRLLPIKGFDVLVSALGLLAAQGEDARLCLVGPDRDDHRDRLLRLAAREGVADRLTFAGEVPLGEVREFLAGAHVVAVPSLEEGGNKVLLEAAAVGTPFVATDTTGNSDWARGWSCGVVVPSGSPAALAAGLRSVLEDPGSAAAMGRHGIRFAEFFRTRAVAERILALCGHAVQGGDLPPDLREPAGLRGAAEDPSPPPSSAGRP